MTIRDAMSVVDVTVGPGHTLAEAAKRMVQGNTGAAVVYDPDGPGPGIVTERDLLRAVAAGADPAIAPVGEHMTARVQSIGPDADLDDAAATMTAHNIRHLLVIDGTELVGIVSIRDIVRARVTA
jgi:CBS domain-containing protein